MNNKNLYDEGDINEDEDQENEEEQDDSEIIENNDDFVDDNEESDKDETIRANIINGVQSKVDEEEQGNGTKEIEALNELNDNEKTNNMDQDNQFQSREEKNNNDNVKEKNLKESSPYSNEDLITILTSQDNNQNEISQIKISNKIPINYSSSAEIEKDFDVALTKILSKMVKESNNNDEIYDILLSDKEKVEEELNKYEFARKVNIDEKIKVFLEKKEKNIKTIEDKINEELKKQCTFAPNTNATTQSKQRNLTQFLKDQENYQKRLNEKLSNLKSNQEQEEIKELKQKPQICNTSSKVAQNKNKGEEVHERLYNKRAQTAIPSSTNSSNVNNNKNPTLTIKQSHTNNNKQNEEKFEHLYQEAKIREKRNKEKENQQTKEIKEANQYKSNAISNKYLFKRFKQLYKEEVEKLLSKNDSSRPQLTFALMKELLMNLNLYPSCKANEIETQLLNEINDNLKREDDSISIEHMFIFCLSILNLLEYYLVSSYQKDFQIGNSPSQQTLKTCQSGKTLKSSNSQANNLQDENLIELKRKLDSDLNNRIVTQKKYGGYDCEGNFIISLTHSKLIFKDFTVLYQNYSNNNLSTKNKKNNNVIDPPPFKPTINPKSTELLNNKNKLKQIKDSYKTEFDKSNSNNNLLEINNTSPNNNANGLSINKSTQMNANSRIDMLYLESTKKKNAIEQHERLKKEKEQKEFELCTFKPKINTNYQMKNNVFPIDQSQTIEQRVEMLYKKGTEQIIHRKNKSKTEIEFERSEKDCTFKPIVHDINQEIFDKKYSVCQDDDLIKFNKRLKNGRFERELKGSFFERGEYPVLQRNRSENKILRKRIPINSNNSVNKTPKTEVKQKPIQQKENQIPVLQIDVNLKNGVKKKVFVFEGDTSEQLAENFAIENNLEDNMKKKLQSLIQIQIDKLLMNIAEESATSYKSNN